jgi:hypothetical protein
MQLPTKVRAKIVRALQAGKQPLEIARELGISLLAIADIVLRKYVK